MVFEVWAHLPKNWISPHKPFNMSSTDCIFRHESFSQLRSKAIRTGFCKETVQWKPSTGQFAQPLTVHLDLLTKLANIALGGGLPPDLQPFFCSGRLVPINKKDERIRPLVVGECHRAVIAKAANREYGGGITDPQPLQMPPCIQAARRRPMWLLTTFPGCWTAITGVILVQTMSHSHVTETLINRRPQNLTQRNPGIAIRSSRRMDSCLHPHADGLRDPIISSPAACSASLVNCRNGAWFHRPSDLHRAKNLHLEHADSRNSRRCTRTLPSKAADGPSPPPCHPRPLAVHRPTLETPSSFAHNTTRHSMDRFFPTLPSLTPTEVRCALRWTMGIEQRFGSYTCPCNSSGAISQGHTALRDTQFFRQAGHPLLPEQSVPGHDESRPADLQLLSWPS